MRTTSVRGPLALPCPHIWMVPIVAYAKRYAVPAIAACADANRVACVTHRISRWLRVRQQWWLQRRLMSGLVHGHPWGMVSDRTNLLQQ